MRFHTPSQGSLNRRRGGHGRGKLNWGVPFHPWELPKVWESETYTYFVSCYVLASERRAKKGKDQTAALTGEQDGPGPCQVD